MNPAMKSARTSGELARRADKPLSANPYRRSASTRSPRRGSWSEAFARQWALGWTEVDEQLQSQPAPAVTGRDEEEPHVGRSMKPAKATDPPTTQKGVLQHG